MEQNLKIIREAVIKIIPEIMELKFGCETTYGKIGLYDKYVKSFLAFSPTGDSRIFSEDTNLVEILGRPIRLADVLFTMNKVAQKTDYIYQVTTNGEFVKESRETGTTEEVAFWNHIDDDLSHQSPECLEFLAGLLTS